jgi:hypothetical protein
MHSGILALLCRRIHFVEASWFSSSLVCSCCSWGANPKIEPRPCSQQAYCVTLYHKELCCTFLLYAAPSWVLSYTLHPTELCCTLYMKSYAAKYWATPNPSELHWTLCANLHPIERPCTHWASVHPFELRCSLLSFAAHYCATLHPTELRCTLLGYAAPSELRCNPTELSSFI